MTLIIIPDGEIGPIWATDLNQNWSQINTHTHTDGVDAIGARIHLSQLDFINDFFVSNILNTSILNFSSYSGPNIKNSIFTDGTDLFTVDGEGKSIQITQFGHITTQTTDSGFSGDYVTATAEVIYTNSTTTYDFRGNAAGNAANIFANNLDCTDIILANNCSIFSKFNYNVPITTAINTSPSPTANFGIMTTVPGGTLQNQGSCLEYTGISDATTWIIDTLILGLTTYDAFSYEIFTDPDPLGLTLELESDSTKYSPSIVTTTYASPSVSSTSGFFMGGFNQEYIQVIANTATISSKYLTARPITTTIKEQAFPIIRRLP